MLSFFVATAMLAYLSLYRLTSDRWIALVTTLLSFSSFYCLYYNDMVTTEIGMDLFGVMLTFHGMVVFVQEDRFRQLLAKTCIALLLGWHVLALLFPFVIFSLGCELLHARNNGKRLVLSLLRSQSLRLGIVSLLFGVSVLALNFVMEYIALNGETPLTQLPSYGSMLRRTGQVPGAYAEYAHLLAWGSFLNEQFSWIGRMMLPYHLLGRLSVVQNPWMMPDLSILGMIATVTCLIGLIFVRHKILLASFLLSGFCWTLPMRHSVAFHPFESLFYVVIPLVFFTLGLLWICKLSNDRIMIPLTIAALLIFGVSSVQISQVGYGAETSEFHQAMMDDFEVIRKITKGKTIFVPQKQFDTDGKFSGAYQSTSYYLAGSVISYLDEQNDDALSEFFIEPKREEVSALLTPENRLMFLYDREIYDKEQEYSRIVSAGDLIVDSKFDVYHYENEFYYIKESCSPGDIETPILMNIYPIDTQDLPDNYKQSGFENIAFHFEEKGTRFAGTKKCMAGIVLPEYDIDYIKISQNDGSDRLWSSVVDVRDVLYRSRYPSVLNGDPVARSTFDLYLDGNILYYIKEPCSSDDIETPFFIKIHPVYTRDLPDHGKHDDFDSLSFSFQKKGVIFDGKCIAGIVLPEYIIDYIETGQWPYNKGIAWETIHYLTVYDKYKMLVSEEPQIRSDFDVYHRRNTLTYFKEPCTPFDTKSKFQLRINPADQNDLPYERKRYGFDNLDFYFKPNGTYFDRKCMITVLLPEYKIDSIETGQFVVNIGTDGKRHYTTLWHGAFIHRMIYAESAVLHDDGESGSRSAMQPEGRHRERRRAR